MALRRDLSIDTTTILGRRLLRFTTVIVNVGAGPFETIGSRPDAGTSQMAKLHPLWQAPSRGAGEMDDGRGRWAGRGAGGDAGMA
jgi:hypothetical protein